MTHTTYHRKDIKMKPQNSLTKQLLLIVFIFSLNISAGFKLVAYFPLYSTESYANSVDYSQFTHVNIEAIYSTAEGKLEIPSWSGSGVKELTLIDTVVSKCQSSNTKVLLTVGYTTSTLEMITDSAAREKFSDTLIQYCKEKGINGIDLDLEGNFDSDGYAIFANLLRTKIDTCDLLLSAAVTGSPSYSGNKWTDEFLSCLDYINVMIYDLKGSWNGSPIGNHSSYSDFTSAATEWNKRISKDKIILGTPLYGRTFADDGTMRIWGNNSWSSNTILYKDIKFFFPEELLTDTTAGEFNKKINDLNLSSEELATFNTNVCENSTALTGSDMLGKTFYSGPILTKKKTKYALEENFGGIMILKLSYDSDDSTSLTRMIYNEIETYKTSNSELPKTLKNKHNFYFLNKIISCPFENINSVIVYSLNGKRLLQKPFKDFKQMPANNKLNCSKGIYFLKLISSDNRCYTEKIILTK